MNPDKIKVLTDYDESGFGLPTEEIEFTIKLVVRSGGILLDPVYTENVITVQIDLIQQDVIHKEEIVVF